MTGGAHEVVEHVVMGGDDLMATNSKEMANRVLPRSDPHHRIDGESLSVRLPPVSWPMIRTAAA